MTKPQRIDPSKIRSGPIRHESLPKQLLDRIGAVHKLIGAYLNMSLEEFEVGFMRDAHPERELAVWCRIAAAWLDYHEQFIEDKVLSDAEEKKLLGALIQISGGMDDPAAFSVPPETATRLIGCYRES
jgi:hypothetical protein